MEDNDGEVVKSMLMWYGAHLISSGAKNACSYSSVLAGSPSINMTSDFNWSTDNCMTDSDVIRPFVNDFNSR